jgi:hypothetical protein
MALPSWQVSIAFDDWKVRDPRLPLPMTRDVVPLVLNRIPSIRDPVLATAFGYPGAGVPFKETPIPLPIARCPNISIAV